MIDAGVLAVYGSLLVAGLAGSLHCIGMCGPILISFSQVFDESSRNVGRAARGRALDFTWYHLGRLWTYGMLGFVAGLAGLGLRETSWHLGWQRPMAVVIGGTVALSGLLLLLGSPGSRFGAFLSGCGLGGVRSKSWFRELLEGPGALPRLLLGAVMGLLPCGLVYAMLVAVAALPSPLHSAAGMVVFGIGTLPALSAVLLARMGIPARWRAQGTRIAAIALILAGCWMAARTFVSPAETGCPLHSTPGSAVVATDRI